MRSCRGLFAQEIHPYSVLAPASPSPSPQSIPPPAAFPPRSGAGVEPARPRPAGCSALAPPPPFQWRSHPCRPAARRPPIPAWRRPSRGTAPAVSVHRRPRRSRLVPRCRRPQCRRPIGHGFAEDVIPTGMARPAPAFASSCASAASTATSYTATSPLASVMPGLARTSPAPCRAAGRIWRAAYRPAGRSPYAQRRLVI